MSAVLDHVAIGAWSRDDVAGDFQVQQGGREVARFAIPSWAGVQLCFAGGIRLEVLEPVPDPADDFLNRFLARSGVGPHHATFKVEDIRTSLAHLERLGIQPVKVDLSDPNWQEAFLHPALGLGTVVQLAQAGGQWKAEVDPGPPPAGAPRVEFLGAELVADPAMADQVFGDVLSGVRHTSADGVAYGWPGGSMLVRAAPPERRPHVEALVFRQVGGSPGPPAGTAQLYSSPAKLVTLAPGAAWPPA